MIQFTDNESSLDGAAVRLRIACDTYAKAHAAYFKKVAEGMPPSWDDGRAMTHAAQGLESAVDAFNRARTNRDGEAARRSRAEKRHG